MQRVSRVRERDAAMQRLLLALVLSVLLHVIFVGVTSDRKHAVTGSALDVQISLPGSVTATAALHAELLHRQSVQPPALPEHVPLWAWAFFGQYPDSHYYAAADLDVLPVPRRPIRLPEGRSTTGAFRLLARIDASGRVVDVSVFDADSTQPVVADAMAVLRATPFLAARKADRAVRSEVVIELSADWSA